MGTHPKEPASSDSWTEAREAGLVRACKLWDSMEAEEVKKAYMRFRPFPAAGKAGKSVVCECCGLSVRACSLKWAEFLSVEVESIEHYFRFREKGVDMGLGCAMDSLLHTGHAKYQTDLSVYWAHITKVIVLLKMEEVAKYVAMGGRLKARQEMENRFPCMYLSAEEALELLVKKDDFNFPLNTYERANVFALSYSWHAREHPDPTGTTAETVVQGLRETKNWWLSKCRKFLTAGWEEGEKLLKRERGGKREKKEGEEDEESWMEKHFKKQSNEEESVSLPYSTWGFPLLFQDFPSLPQRPRTPEEDICFSKGLSLLSCLYGNTSFQVYFLRCTEIPSDLEEVTNRTPYDERGWTNFESRVSSVKHKDYILQVGPLSQTLVQIPLSPPAFQKKLDDKRREEESESNPEGFVVRFTNGRTDRELVSELYKRFILDTQVSCQRVISMWGKYEIDTLEKGEMLGDYFRWIGEQPQCEVEEVCLWGCSLNALSLPPLAAGLCALSTLRELDLGSFGGAEFGPSSLEALSSLQQLKVGL
uniref:Uncharacterized protein n=1 Tax=Chromera velia CCMP2878 TaxID=1169474 RepID=A0A0G4HEF7_9ALVE|eukprot:Cvel_6487.t1-p1 / transcript=Cvel_6487.t1 / gene=Cvel_6487 / organism=Chromera_velia_CCMP2878 / gene_product=hypothetical protein / transcript_product=hypothetical protein / location=Cvel_scaffold318:36843-38441(+) / protein_length=533 / sequence_SO=supercontig / SO=protein_coding / is_pseudo=false